jgi:Rieske 2Fe-2S family protein
MSDTSTIVRLRDGYATLPGWPLAQEYYTSEYWHERDLERVFRRRWLFAGHASQIAEPGQFFTFELDRDSVVVARTGKGEIAAFHNVCRHRGTRFCQQRSGQVRSFRCPFHGWSYGLDGRLVTAPLMGAEFDKARFPAKPVWVEEWNGIIFLNLSVEQPALSVAEALGDVNFATFELANTKVIAERTYELASNWKIAAETFHECYHCKLNHPELCSVIDPSAFLAEPEDFADDTSADFLSYYDNDSDGDGVMKPGPLSYTLDGQYVCKRLFGAAESPAGVNRGLTWFPHFGLHLSPDYGNTFSWLPISPTRSRFRSTWFVNADAREGVDYEVDEVINFMHVTNLEDEELCRVMQEGINSTAYDNSAPHHVGFETSPRRFMRTYFEYVGDPHSTS